MIEAVLEVGEEIPVAGKLVELIHKFYSAAKGAQTNQAEREAFARQVKIVEGLLGKAQRQNLKDEEQIQPSIEEVERIMENAIHFVEGLQGSGFFRRVFKSSSDERKLRDLSDKLSKAVQLMIADVSLSQGLGSQKLDEAAEKDRQTHVELQEAIGRC